MNKDLFEVNKHGDRRTVVRTMKKGKVLRFADGRVVTVKADCKIKVTQEYSSKNEEWGDCAYNLEDAVPFERRDEDAQDLPRASVKRLGWWSRIVAWFWRDVSGET